MDIAVVDKSDLYKDFKDVNEWWAEKISSFLVDFKKIYCI